MLVMKASTTTLLLHLDFMEMKYPKLDCESTTLKMVENP